MSVTEADLIEIFGAERVEAGSVPGGADPWLNNQNGKPVLRIYWGEIQVVYPQRQTRERKTTKSKKPQRKAGDIQTFSKKSRLRMMRVYNRIQQCKLGKPIFMTLTARPECFSSRKQFVPEDYRQAPHSYVFLKEFIPLLKEIVPGAAYIWKLEPHKSGSAHYHLILWSADRARKLSAEFYKRKIRALWRNCIDDHSRSAELYSCKITRIRSTDEAFHYCSKYLMKEDPDNHPGLVGRRWARSASLPVDAITEMRISRDEAERLRLLALEKVVRQKGRQDEYIEAYPKGYGFFVWVDEREVEKFLETVDLQELLLMWQTFRAIGKLQGK